MRVGEKEGGQWGIEECVGVGLLRGRSRSRWVG